MNSVHATFDLAGWDREALVEHAQNLRTDEDLDRLWSSGLARMLVVNADDEFVADPLGQAVSGERGDAVLLGLVGDTPWFARRGWVDHGCTIRHRDLTPLHYQLVSIALAVLNWQEGTRCCPCCGGGLRATMGGFAATCRVCRREVFPRTDPAIIVAVLDEQDRIFLAHQFSWAANRASILAGFVEAGESAEQAVYREVAEESRLKVEACRFLGSQPWPFPRSLMLGYVARTYSTGCVDGRELEWGRWYSRSDVEAAEASGALVLPGPGSIARRILDAWRAGDLPSPD